MVARLQRVDKRWEAAICHRLYRDEATAEKPFTAPEWNQFLWACAWRDLFHKYEEALYAHPDIRAGLVEGITTREPLTIYEPT